MYRIFNFLSEKIIVLINFTKKSIYFMKNYCFAIADLQVVIQYSINDKQGFLTPLS